MSRWPRARLRRAASSILRAALDAADPVVLVRRHLQRRGPLVRLAGVTHRVGRGRLVVVAVGKAASPMAAAARGVLGSAVDEALAVDTTSAHAAPGTETLVAGHPLPDERGLRAALRVLRLADGLASRDTLLLLLSGGASALLPAPVAGVSLDDKARVTRALLLAGAPIAEVNAVRRHLSRLKGGGLARAAAPARVVCLALSDVIGDSPADIGSGPVTPDPTTYADALRILAGRGVLARAPRSVVRHLERGARDEAASAAASVDACFRRVTLRVVGSNRLSVAAAAARARALGLRCLVLTTRLEGEAREAGAVLASVLRECVESGRPARPPVCLVAGGETTVTVRGGGRGGRNQEMAVGAALALQGCPGAAVAAFLATDGRDGASESAGGVIDDLSVARGEALGLAPPEVFLAHNDCDGYLASIGGLLLTGPTGTNIADIALLLAGDRPSGRGL